MALNAIRGGHRLVVHDIRRESATPHLEMGAEWADTPREVAERSEVVLHFAARAGGGGGGRAGRGRDWRRSERGQGVSGFSALARRTSSGG